MVSMCQQSAWKEEPVDPLRAANVNAEQREAKANSMYESSVQGVRLDLSFLCTQLSSSPPSPSLASDVECQPHFQKEICTRLIPLREAVIPPSLMCT